MDNKVYCVLCHREAIGTAGHIPVCAEHYRQYKEEGQQYLPAPQREVWHSLQQAYARQQHTLKPLAAHDLSKVMALVEVLASDNQTYEQIEALCKEWQVTPEYITGAEVAPLIRMGIGLPLEELETISRLARHALDSMEGK